MGVPHLLKCIFNLHCRGSPHIHGEFWINESPDVSNIETVSDVEMEGIVQYFSDKVDAWSPIVDAGKSDVHPC